MIIKIDGEGWERRFEWTITPCGECEATFEMKFIEDRGIDFKEICKNCKFTVEGILKEPIELIKEP